MSQEPLDSVWSFYGPLGSPLCRVLTVVHRITAWGGHRKESPSPSLTSFLGIHTTKAWVLLYLNIHTTEGRVFYSNVHTIFLVLSLLFPPQKPRCKVCSSQARSGLMFFFQPASFKCIWSVRQCHSRNVGTASAHSAGTVTELRVPGVCCYSTSRAVWAGVSSVTHCHDGVL